jgi:hypothetical protein
MSQTLRLSQSIRLCSMSRESCGRLGTLKAAHTVEFFTARRPCSPLAPMPAQNPGRMISSNLLRYGGRHSVRQALQSQLGIDAVFGERPAGHTKSPSNLLQHCSSSLQNLWICAPFFQYKGVEVDLHSKTPIVCQAAIRQEGQSAGIIGEKRLILYSKPGCHLCDGLKEKLDMAFMLSGEHSITGVELEVSNELEVLQATCSV